MLTSSTSAHQLLAKRALYRSRRRVRKHIMSSSSPSDSQLLQTLLDNTPDAKACIQYLFSEATPEYRRFLLDTIEAHSRSMDETSVVEGSIILGGQPEPANTSPNSGEFMPQSQSSSPRMHMTFIEQQLHLARLDAKEAGRKADIEIQRLRAELVAVRSQASADLQAAGAVLEVTRVEAKEEIKAAVEQGAKALQDARAEAKAELQAARAQAREDLRATTEKAEQSLHDARADAKTDKVFFMSVIEKLGQKEKG
ncbi:hypothetical protein B0H16DRAFT_1539042 [Mycena metata]|uniref:Uncharacterized protein n=1 Tax=Mycena metata TaxID=1033252 RepID=A0AAD7NEB0_9AGAR|nr:hypothetical protein B0H16DRAFT_1539042 [Mycena metata]